MRTDLRKGDGFIDLSLLMLLAGDTFKTKVSLPTGSCLQQQRKGVPRKARASVPKRTKDFIVNQSEKRMSSCELVRRNRR